MANDLLKRKAKKVLDNVNKDGSSNMPMAQLEATLELSDKIDELIKSIPKMPESMKMEMPGIEMVTMKGDRGDAGNDGRTPTENELRDIILQLIPETKDGKDGYSPIKNKDYFDGKTPTKSELLELIEPLIPLVENGQDGKDGSPDTPVQLRDKLELLKDDERLDFSAIKGTEKLVTIENLDRSISILDQRTQYLINKNSNITGLIRSGTDVIITGSGTTDDPYVISSSGGSLTLGEPVILGTPYANLYVDRSGNILDGFLLYDLAGMVSVDIGNRFLVDVNSTAIFQYADLTTDLIWGDVSGLGNLTQAVLNDPRSSFRFQNNGNAFLNIEPNLLSVLNGASFQFGDTAGITNATADFEINGIIAGFNPNSQHGWEAHIGDTNSLGQYLSITRTSGGNFGNTLTNHEYWFGDKGGIDGLAVHIIDNTGSDSPPAISSRKMTLGDVNGAFNNTSIKIDDITQKILFNGNYAFPFNDGSAGQALVTDGAGTLSFADPAAIDTVQYETPTTGSTVTSNGKTQLILNPAGAILALTVVFPASPADGQRFGISSTQPITTLTLSGGTILAGLTTIGANGFAAWIYSNDASEWIRTG